MGRAGDWGLGVWVVFTSTKLTCLFGRVLGLEGGGFWGGDCNGGVMGAWPCKSRSFMISEISRWSWMSCSCYFWVLSSGLFDEVSDTELLEESESE